MVWTKYYAFNNILHESGRSLTFEESVYMSVVNCNHYNYMSLIDAIPQWRKLNIRNHKEELCNLEISTLSQKFGSAIKPMDKMQSMNI